MLRSGYKFSTSQDRDVNHGEGQKTAEENYGQQQGHEERTAERQETPAEAQSVLRKPSPGRWKGLSRETWSQEKEPQRRAKETSSPVISAIFVILRDYQNQALVLHRTGWKARSSSLDPSLVFMFCFYLFVIGSRVTQDDHNFLWS